MFCSAVAEWFQATSDIDDVSIVSHAPSRQRISRYFCHAQQNGEGICTAGSERGVACIQR